MTVWGCILHMCVCHGSPVRIGSDRFSRIGANQGDSDARCGPTRIDPPDSHGNGSPAAPRRSSSESMGTQEDSVEREAAARRERLRALRAAKELLSTPDDDAAASATVAHADDADPEPRHRSGDDLRLGGFQETEENHREPEVPDKDSVSQAVAARHERLKALKAAKELLGTPDGSIQTGSKTEDSEEVEEEKMNVKFRNYLPHDKQLQGHKLAPPVLPKFDDPVAAEPVPAKTEDPFVNIAPKKPNWDLRRDVQKKLDKLERRTQKALYQLYLEQEEQREGQALEGNNETGPED